MQLTSLCSCWVMAVTQLGCSNGNQPWCFDFWHPCKVHCHVWRTWKHQRLVSGFLWGRKRLHFREKTEPHRFGYLVFRQLVGGEGRDCSTRSPAVLHHSAGALSWISTFWLVFRFRVCQLLLSSENWSLKLFSFFLVSSSAFCRQKPCWHVYTWKGDQCQHQFSRQSKTSLLQSKGQLMLIWTKC